MPLLGELCALLAPLCWSVAVILFRRTEAPSPMAMNLFKNVLAFGLLTLTLGVLGVPLAVDRPGAHWVAIALSGVLGLAVADTLLFAALRRIGAARLAVVDIAYAPIVALLAALFLGEELGRAYAVGAGLVLIGVGVATIEPRALQGEPVDRAGVLLGLGAICGTALGVVLAKPVLEQSHLIEITWLRLGFGIVAQLVWIAAFRQWPDARAVFRPSPTWRTLVPATLVGTYLSLILWLGGFKWAPASVAAVLNQMATVYILVLAWLVLGERIPPRGVLGAAIAIGGALVIVLTR